MSKIYDKRLFDALMSSHLVGPSTKVGKKYIGPILCDACGEWRGYSFTDSPRKILCNKAGCRAYKDNGGINTAEVLGISFDYEKEFKPSKSEPHRPAREYLISERSLPVEIVRESSCEYRRVKRKGMAHPVGGVFWQLYDPEKGAWSKDCLNGRGVDSRMKSHNIGKWAGKYYRHRAFSYTPADETWIAECPIDCLSLLSAGVQSIGLVSAGTPPDINLEGLEQKIILAPDNDAAGIGMIRKWQKKYPDALVMLPPLGRDWNDLQRQHGSNWKNYFQNNRDTFLFYGQLSIAGTAKEYATLYREFFHRVPGLFVHDGCTWFSSLKKKGDDTSIVVERCGRFTLKVISFHKDTRIPDRPEYWYHLQITPKGGRPVNAKASGRDLATPRGLKEFLLTRAKVSFEGGTQASTAIATMITSNSKAPEVLQFHLTGHDLESGWYVFKYVAIDPTGKLHRPDKRGLYKISFRDYGAPPAHSGEKAIVPAEKGLPIKNIHHLIVEAWGPRGAAALAWVTASWFTTQIKEKIGFFPFASFWGDVQAAKSSLVVILNQLQGFDTEGCSSSSLNTRKGLVRNIGRVANLFTAIIEGNVRDERSSFDYSSLLPLYNKNPLQVKAVFSNDMQTVETPFLGALAFSANNEVFRGKAEKERVVSLEFKTDHLTESTKVAYDRLSAIPLPVLARTIMLTLRHRQVFGNEWYAAFQKASNDLDAVSNRRIRENHALILAFHRLFCKVHSIKNSRLKSFMEEAAKLKEITAAQKEHTIADDFFEKIDLIAEDKTGDCLHMDKGSGIIYFYMAKIEQNLRNIGFQFTANERLFEALRLHPGFVKASHLFRFPDDCETGTDGRPKVRRTWMFNAKKMG